MIEGFRLAVGDKVEREIERSFAQVSSHGAAHVEDRRPGQTKVREKERLATLKHYLARRVDNSRDDIGHGQTLQTGHPIGNHAQGDQRRLGFHDRVTKTLGESIAIATRSRPWIRLPSNGDDQSAAGHPALGQGDGEAPFDRFDVERRRVAADRTASASEATEQSIENIQRLIGRGEDLAVPFDLGRDSLALEELDRTLDRERLQGWPEELSSGVKRLLDAPRTERLARVIRWVDRPRNASERSQAPRVGEVAARSSRHEDLDAGPPVLFQNQGVRAEFRRANPGE